MADNQTLFLREDNPYSIGTIFGFDEGDSLLDGPEIEIPTSPRDRYYTIKKDDDLWNIAFQAYNGNSKWYWIIMLANDLEFSMELPIGKTIRIPDLEISQISL